VGIIDLKSLFGGRYRITLDPAEHGHRNPDPMYYVILCKYGEIYPYSDTELAVMVTSIRLGNAMRSIPQLKAHQVADDAIIFRFSPVDFDLVAKWVKPFKRRQISTETMRNIGARTAYRCTSATKVQRSGVR
jgi:hypothetical protein